MDTCPSTSLTGLFGEPFDTEDLTTDREVVLTAMTYNGRLLNCVSEALRRDREVVLAAVTQDGYALKFASDDLQKDREVVINQKNKST